jgi:hypothetical protein
MQTRQWKHENRSKFKLNILARFVALAWGCFMAANAAFAQTQTLTFMSTTYADGDTFGDLTPVCVVAADVNGDGKPDLISANGADDTLMILTNNGSGDFGSNALINLGAGAYWVAAADINGDNIQDLIVANFNNPGTLTVLTNNGSGVFSTNAILPTGYNPMCVVAADINNDHKVDLISADFYASTLTVYTNNGSGGFGFHATLGAGAFPVVVIAADLNGDGKVDLISVNEYANTLTVLTNNGSGDFGSNATYNVGDEPVSVVAADINGDGKLDLITANNGYASGNTLTVLTNNGSGIFGSNATLTVGVEPTCVIAADINGDGKVDLICANQNDDTLTILTNSGSGDFGSNTSLAVNFYPVGFVAADVNGDGKLDLISGDHDTGLTVLTQIGFTAWWYPTTNESLSIAVMDVNNDGKPDLITANGEYIVHNDDAGAGDNLTVYTNTGHGVFGFYANLGVGSEPSCVVAADVNRDDALDLICANANSSGFGSLSILTNNAQGGFGLDETLTLGEYADPTCIAAVDVNGNGKVGLAAIAADELQLFTNNGSGFIAFDSVLAPGDAPLFVAAADVNGDGKVDLICVNGSINKQNDENGALLVLTNDGSGGFVSNAIYEVGRAPTWVVAADVNADGWPDLITANGASGSGTLTVLTNDGRGGFVSNTTYQVGFSPRCVVAADINGDGWPDLITATANVDEGTGNTLTVLTNNGRGVFGFYATIAVDTAPSTVVAADLNGDGKLDLIVTSTDGMMTVLLNTITFPTPSMQPNLNMTLSGPNLVMSWPSSAANFVVQTNSNLSGTNWGTAGYAIATNGANQTVTIPPPPGNLFFRLFHP